MPRHLNQRTVEALLNKFKRINDFNIVFLDKCIIIELAEVMSYLQNAVLAANIMNERNYT